MYAKYCLTRPVSYYYAHQPAKSNAVVAKPVCGVCVAKSDEERKALLEERDKLEVWRLAKLPLVCGTCRGPLKTTGPMWWIGSKGERDCENDTHPPWAGL